MIYLKPKGKDRDAITEFLIMTVLDESRPLGAYVPRSKKIYLYPHKRWEKPINTVNHEFMHKILHARINLQTGQRYDNKLIVRMERWIGWR